MASEVTKKPRKMRPAHSRAAAANAPGSSAHSYTSRKRRTSRIANRFITNVMTKSAAPTAKIVLYSIDPVGTSP